MGNSTAEANKRVVAEFMQRVFGEKHYDDETLAKYVAADYIEHNPDCPDGRDTLKAFEPVLDKFETVRIVAEGDTVWSHNRFLLEGKKSVSVDIFRVKDGKVVEHWDVIQEFPAEGTAKSLHPMF